MLGLTFTPPKAIPGGLIMSEAVPGSQFWVKWRSNRQSLMDAGLSLAVSPDAAGRREYRVRWLRRCNVGGEIMAVPASSPVYVSDTEGLLDYQPQAVSLLLAALTAHQVAVDGSDTGTGKTYVALKTAALLGLKPCVVTTKTGIADWWRVAKSMNVAPLAVWNWESSIGRKYRAGKFHQPVNPWVRAEKNDYTGQWEYHWTTPSGTLIIFDEAHRGGGESASRDIMLAAKDRPRLFLSATLADKITKLRVIGAAVRLFHYEEFDAWLRAQGTYVDKYDGYQPIDESTLLEKVHRYLYPAFGVRIRKSEVPGFPDCQNIARLYEIEKARVQNAQYTKLLNELARLRELKKTAEMLVAQLRYRQMTELYKVPLLENLVAEYLDGGFSVVVFVNFKNTLDALREALKTDCIIEGGQNEDERRVNLDAFQADKKRVLISNIQAGGVGISLHDLNGKYPRVALICPTYDAKMLVQAMGRVHRAGARTKAMNVLVYAAGTVEEKVFEAVKLKLNNLAMLNDGELSPGGLFAEETNEKGQ